MDPFDLSILPTPEEEAQARLAALRGEREAKRSQGLGLLAQLTGDRVLAPVGGQLQAGARQQMDLLEAMKQHAAQSKQAGAQMAITAEDRRIDNARQAEQAKESSRHNRASEQAAFAAAGANRGLREQAAEDRGERLKDKELGELRKALDPTQGRANLPAQAKASQMAAERLEALLSSKLVNPEQVMEAATMAATIANGGHVPTQHQVEAMVPKSWKGDLAKFAEYVVAKPVDAGAREFLNNLAKQSEREKRVSETQIKNMLGERVPGFGHVIKRYPEAWNALPPGMKREDFDPETMKLLKPYESGIENENAVVRIRPKGTQGPGKVVSPEEAKKFLSDPRFEMVPNG